MSREMIMTVVLIALVGVAGYMYQDMVMDYANPVVNPVMNMLGYGGDTAEDQSKPEGPDLSPDVLLEKSLNNFLNSVQRSVNIPRRDMDSFQEINGVAFDLHVESQIPDEVTNAPEWSNINLNLSNRSYFSGGVESTVQINQPEAFPVPNVKLVQNESNFQLIFPESSEFFQSDIKTALKGQEVDTSAFRFGQQLTDRVEGDVVQTEWNGQKTNAVRVNNLNDTGTSVFYLTMNQPYSILGTEVNYSGETKQTTKIDYRSDRRRMLRSVTSTEDDTTKLEFQYGNDLLQVIRISPATTDNYETMKLSFSHGDEYSRAADLTARSPDREKPVTLAHFEWGFNEGQLSSFLFDGSYPVKDKEVTVSLSLEKLEWLRDEGSIQLADVSGMSELSQSELGQKFTPVAMMAMSAINQSTSSGEALTASEQDGEMSEGTMTGETDEETRGEQQSTESTDGSADEDAEQAETGAAKQPAETGEQEPDSTSPDQQRVSTDQDRTESTEVAPNSGETIKYSSVGRFPMSEPPAEYEEARDAYHDGDFSRAQSKLKNLVETYPNSANVNYLLGVTYFEQGEFEQSKPYFQKASELDHDPQIKVWSEQYLDRIDNKANSG